MHHSVHENHYWVFCTWVWNLCCFNNRKDLWHVLHRSANGFCCCSWRRCVPMSCTLKMTRLVLAMCRNKHPLAVYKVHEHRRLPTTLEICPFPFVMAWTMTHWWQFFRSWWKPCANCRGVSLCHLAALVPSFDNRSSGTARRDLLLPRWVSMSRLPELHLRMPDTPLLLVRIPAHDHPGLWEVCFLPVLPYHQCRWNRQQFLEKAEHCLEGGTCARQTSMAKYERDLGLCRFLRPIYVGDFRLRTGGLRQW